MSKYSLTVGHYASHRNTGGYQPLKTDIPKAQFPPKSSGVESMPENKVRITTESPLVCELCGQHAKETHTYDEKQVCPVCITRNEKYKIRIGDAPICEVCGLYSFETSDYDGKQMCPLCRFKEGDKMEPGCKTRPSELELRIRREVMKEIEELLDSAYGKTLITCEHQLAIITKIKDRLNLLWGSNE